MTIGFDDFTRQGPKKNGAKQKQANGATYTVYSDKHGHYYHHPQQGRVKVVALFCDCGRSILVRPADAKGASIVCNLCNSAFSWQQLTFDAD